MQRDPTDLAPPPAVGSRAAKDATLDPTYGCAHFEMDRSPPTAAPTVIATAPAPDVLDGLMAAALGRFSGLVAATAARGGDGADVLTRALPRLALAGAAPPRRPARPVRKPVALWLDGIAARPPDDPALALLIADLARLAPHAEWRQNPSYSAERVGQHFMDGYGYLELAGPLGPYVDHGLLAGVLLLGPGRLYPPHTHPAEEVYIPLSGTAEWWREGARFCAVAPGTAIHHPSNVRHATRTLDAPLLAAYVWLGDVATPARLSG